MIYGLGIDLVEIDRLESLLERHRDAFMRKVFTDREQQAFANPEADDGSRYLQEVGARFAAKEAAFKALGTGWGQGVSWLDVEILGGRGEPPHLEWGGRAKAHLLGMGASRALVSMTHTGRAAAATVILV